MRCARCGRDIPAAESNEFVQLDPLAPDDAATYCSECLASTERDVPGVMFTAVPTELWVDDKTRETRLRQLAKRQGLLLMKSERYASHGTGWDLYWPATLTGRDHWPNRLLVSPDIGLTLDGVEEFLTYGTTRASIMEYLIRSYGPVFVEELNKHLPQPRTNASNLGQE